jgi:hypothetical protein
MVITKIVLNPKKQRAGGVHRPLKVIRFNARAFGGGAVSSVNSCKTYIYMRLFSQRHISTLLRGFSFKIITFI